MTGYTITFYDGRGPWTTSVSTLSHNLLPAIDTRASQPMMKHA